MQQIKGNSYYLQSQTAIGAYKNGDALLLIDTGLEKDSVKKALRSLEGLTPAVLFNTHSHADHCGGNAYLQKQFNVKTIAPALEAAFIEHPVLESMCLYSASPLAELRNKYICAAASQVDITVDGNSIISIDLGNDPICFEILRLRGHSPNMHGLITPDNIAYLGDALLSEAVLNKHPLFFIHDVAAHFYTLEQLRTLKAAGYVLAHGGYYDDIQALIELNRKTLENTLQLLLGRIRKSPCTIDTLHAYLCKTYSLKENTGQFFLNRSVIMAHIRYLVEHNNIKMNVINGQFQLSL